MKISSQLFMLQRIEEGAFPWRISLRRTTARCNEQAYRGCCLRNGRADCPVVRLPGASCPLPFLALGWAERQLQSGPTPSLPVCVFSSRQAHFFTWLKRAFRLRRNYSVSGKKKKQKTEPISKQAAFSVTSSSSQPRSSWSCAHRAEIQFLLSGTHSGR